MPNGYNMRAQVVDWDCPPDAEPFKDFMLEMLDQSIKGDCGTEYLTKPSLLTGEEWRAREVATAERTLARSTEEYAEAVRRAEERTAYVRAVLTSLPKEKQR